MEIPSHLTWNCFILDSFLVYPSLSYMNACRYFMYDDLKHSCVEGNHIVNIFSFSKAYGMMGWRVGYVSKCLLCLYFHQHKIKALNFIRPTHKFIWNIEFVNHAIQLFWSATLDVPLIYVILLIGKIALELISCINVVLYLFLSL